MTDFGLEKSELDFILKLLRENLPSETRYYIFGSRAKGNYKKFSDVDIAILSDDSKLDGLLLNELVNKFAESLFPYEVDIIDLNAVSQTFKSIISKDLVEIC